MIGAGRNDFAAPAADKPSAESRQPLKWRVGGAIMDEAPTEDFTMRSLSVVSLTLAVCLSAAPTHAAAPQLILSDPGYALWEMRPLDRRVYVLTLEGDWKTPPDFDAEYYVNIEYPNGGVIRHRTLENRQFRKGDVECLLIQYQWEKAHFQKGDKLTVYVSQKKSGIALDDQEVVSNRLIVAWPFDRPVLRLPPRTRFTEREAVDAFNPQGDEPATRPRPAITPPVPPPEEPVKPLEK